MWSGIHWMYIILLGYKLSDGMRKSSDWLYSRYIGRSRNAISTNLSDCPCNVNCPNGCSDCSNPICVCGENPTPQNQLNLETCRKDKSVDLGLCIIECNNDQGCENACVETFKSQYGGCPCQVIVSENFWNANVYFRMNVPLDVHVMHLTVSQTKNPFWFWALITSTNQFLSNMTVS